MSGEDTQSPPTDQGARERAADPSSSVLVQAPAGSGKTTLLTQRYLNLLTRVQAPEGVLALTFTRRAAEEMRTRVISALSAARAPACPAGCDAATWAAARAARRHLEALGVDVERHPSRLRIETIDSFNAWLAGQLPIASGSGAAFQVMPDAAHCLEAAARRALAHESGDRFGAAVNRVLALDDQRWRKLVKVIAGMLGSRERWLPVLAGRLLATGALDEARLEAVRAHFDEDLQLLVLRVLARAPELLGAERLAALGGLLHSAAQRSPPHEALRPWMGAGSVPGPTLEEVPRWRALAQTLLTANGEIRKSVNVADGFPPGCAEKAPLQDLLVELARNEPARRVLLDLRKLPEPRYSDEQWARVRDVAQVLVLAAAELDQVFREQGAADFAAVSMAALRALGSAEAPSDLALKLDYRLQHILVDEFQDTSSAQLELVRLLTAGWQPGDGRTLFCVGDPMQSIYGFRDAEVRAFLELAEQGIGGIALDVERLTANFRSARPLVEWVNETFAQILPRADDRDRGAIAFRPSVALRAGREHAGVVLEAFASRKEEGEGVAAAVAAALGREPGARVAVLVRAKAHAREIAGALRRRGIAFRAVEIEPLQDRSVVRDVIALARALTHLGDRTAWLALLRAPWTGLTLADLWQVAHAPALIWDALKDEAVLGALSEDGRRRCLRFRGVISAAFAVRTQSSLTRWVERTWLALGGPAVLAGAGELELAAAAFGRLRELEELGMPDSAELPDAFSDLYADHGSEGAVEIMTIHKAKGLEFDHVVVPCLDRAVSSSRDRLLETLPFARTDRDGMVMAARPGIGADPDPLFEFLRHQGRDAAQLEAQRLLYVACTRAKTSLLLTACLGVVEPPDEDPDAEVGDAEAWVPARAAVRAGSLLSVLWPVAAAHFAPQGAAPEPGVRSAPQDEAPRGGPLVRVAAEWIVPVAAIAQPVPQAPVPVLREAAPQFDWASEAARRVGLLVHAELQRWAPDTDAAAIEARAAHFRRWLQSHGVPHEHLEDAAGRVVQALLAMQQDERGRWILRRFRDDSRERALSGELDGELVRVIFDRSFVDEGGTRWVIDYKTSQHKGGGIEEFLDREVERYRPQLGRYARLARRLGPEPLRVGLYFPLMRAWREWEP